MSEKNAGIKNLIEAHSWLGVIISVALFIVFWAGSVVLFHHEIQAWAQAPHFAIDKSAPDLPIENIVTQKLTEHRLNNEEHLTIVRADDHHPYHQLYIDLLPEEGYEGPEQVARLLVHPKTGETLADLDDFYLADFLLHLHYDLRLPGGMYLVGVVTLIFLVLMFTGVYIHARKLIANFFLYRSESKRNKKLDMHNVIGVMSLPFGLMYAITGVIFNISLIYQIAFAVFLYDGDQNAMLEDAGYTIISEKPAGKPLDMQPAFDYVRTLEQETGAPVTMLRFYNYGDENAVLQTYATDESRFAQRIERFYRVSDASLVSRADSEHVNAVRSGLDVIASLHFGNFAGVDLRILYLLLGLAVAGMIVVGNLLWLDKRALQKNVSPRAISLVANLTLGGCAGVVLATAGGFLLERILPLGLAARGDWIAYSFGALLALTVATAFFIPHKRHFLRLALWATAGLLVATVIADWVMFGSRMGELWQNGFHQVIGMQTALLISAGVCVWIAKVLGRGASRTEKVEVAELTLANQ
ncbi:PepSY-associated TM helix domain-containing protein [Microbulbifer celer]|uniref:PepSY-associated TM helix domain-containing protein n=1 Tax=Microbulbifer celer TaxID=435905 RepID=A0ABW3UBC3_9GAMM|nr:PepSY-associated TM helix domain-containing protein [Microbulbifer celer]UFN57042.1 PepSY domain-containing protein [Microbulbifer celer]